MFSRQNKPAHMTDKTRAALVLMAELLHVDVDSLPNHRLFVDSVYIELQAQGYVWNASDKVWVAPPPIPAFQTYTLKCTTTLADMEDVLYILTEGIGAAGYEVVIADGFTQPEYPNVGFIHLEIKK